MFGSLPVSPWGLLHLPGWISVVALPATEASNSILSLSLIAGRGCWCHVWCVASPCVPRASTWVLEGNGKPWECHPPEGKLLQSLVGRKLLLVLWSRSSPTCILWCSVRLNCKSCCDFTSLPSVCTWSVSLLGKPPLLSVLAADGLPAACHTDLCLCPLAVGELGSV